MRCEGERSSRYTKANVVGKGLYLSCAARARNAGGSNGQEAEVALCPISKKACFLCYEFMSRYPLTIGVSPSHQKLCPTWMPAPCSSTVRKKHKVLLWDLSWHLEQTAIRDLETRLGIRRPMHMDSTAGPSLTTTGTISLGWLALELPLRSLSRDEQDSSSTVAAAAE